MRSAESLRFQLAFAALPEAEAAVRPRLIPMATLLGVGGAAGWLEAADTPKGAKISVRLNSSISSISARVGDTFEGELAHDLVVNGKTFAPAGARVRGRVTYVESAAISITLDHLDTEAVSCARRTTDFTQRGKGSSPGQRGNAGNVIGDTIGGLGKTLPTATSTWAYPSGKRPGCDHPG